MKLIVAFTLIVLATLCNATSDCQWGPSYWCQSTTTAQQCGQEQYCAKNVWKLKEFSVVQGTECTICKAIVRAVDEYVENNGTESQAQQALDDLCSSLGPVASICKELVDKYFDQIWQLLEQQLDPDKVCTEIGLCSSTKSSNPTLKKFSVVQSTECTICKAIVRAVDEYVENNGTEGQAQQALDDLCSSLGPVASICKELVDKYFDQIWQLLEQQLDPDKVCTEIGLCSSTKSSNPTKFVATKVGSVQCDVCELLVKQVEQLVTSNKTESEVEQILDEVCSKLGALKDECTTVVNGFLPQIWKMIVDELDPDKICTIIGLCKNATETKSQTQYAVSKVGSVQCDVCKIAMELINKEFLKNSTEKEAQQALDDVCSKLGSLGDECKTLVDDFFPTIWDMLVKNADPDTICAAIKLCTSSIKLPIECELCDIVLQKLVDLVMSNTTEDVAKAEVEKVCTYLGGFASMCKSLIDSNWDTLWSLVKKEADNPKAVCDTIFSKCKNQTRISNALVTKLKSNSTIPCALCELVVPFLQYVVDEYSNDAEDDVVEIVSAVCDYFPREPEDYVKKCNDWVNTYIPIIWRRYKDEIDHDEICKDINLCPTLKRKVAPKPVLKAMPKQSGACDLCKTVVGFLKNYVDNSTDEDEIKKALEGLCALLPGNISSECTNLIDHNFDMIWKLVKMEVDTGTICKQLGFCNSTLSTRVQPKAQPTQTVCDMCKSAASFLKHYVDSNATEKEVQQAMESFCKLLPSSVSSQCLSFANESLPELWKAVQQEIDEGKICADLGLCTSVGRTAVSAIAQPTGGVCELCTLATQFLRSYVDSSSDEQQVKEAVESLCKLLSPSLSTECRKYVDENFDLMWKVVQSQVDTGDICTDLGLCSDKAVMLPNKVQDDSILCFLCYISDAFLKQFINNSTNENDLIGGFQKICAILPVNITNQCVSFIQGYIPKLWKLMQLEIDSGELCYDIGACQNKSSLVVVTAVSKPVGGPACEVCKLLIGYLKPFVDNKTAEDKGVQAVQNLCKELPDKYAQECQAQADKYVRQIWDEVRQDVDTGTACDDFCASYPALALVKVPTIKPTPRRVKDTPLCSMCKLVVPFLRHFVDSNSTENEAKDAVETVCNVLPGSLKNECMSLIDGNFDMIWKLLESYVDDDDICTELKLCGNSTFIVLARTQSFVKDTKCKVCELAAKYLAKLIDSQTTEDDAQKALEMFCSVLPSKFGTPCKMLVEDVFPLLWQKLQSETDNPEVACSDVGMCSSSSVVLAATQEKKERASVKGGVLCVLCEYVMKELESLLITNATEADIEAALEKVCSLLPSTITTDCKQFVDKYSKEIIEALLDGATPKVVCSLLKLCLFAEQKVVLAVSENSEISCETCTLAIDTVKLLIKDNEKPVAEVLETVCNYMPDTIQAECKSLIETYTPQIIQLLDDEIDPKSVCKMLKLCESALMKPWTKLLRAKLY